MSDHGGSLGRGALALWMWRRLVTRSRRCNLSQVLMTKGLKRVRNGIEKIGPALPFPGRWGGWAGAGASSFILGLHEATSADLG